MTPMEGRSLLRGGILLFLIALLRTGVERSPGADLHLAAGDSDLEGLLADARVARDEEARRSAPLGEGETIDPNQAEEVELDRLQGVGPSVARAIIEERDTGGGFFRPEDLLRVRGIGPATLEKIRPHLDFPRDPPLTRPPGPGPMDRGSAEGGETGRRPGIVPVASRGSPARRIDVNRAPVEELESLPGIGPALARRIVESRGREGPFRVPDDLLRVRGIGPALLARIRGLVVPR